MSSHTRIFSEIKINFTILCKIHFLKHTHTERDVQLSGLALSVPRYPSAIITIPNTTTAIPGPFRKAGLYPVWHKDHWARTALSLIPTHFAKLLWDHRAHISHNLLHISSASSLLNFRYRVRSAWRPLSQVHLQGLIPQHWAAGSVQESVTHLEGELWPPGGSVIASWVAASSCRQTITWACRLGTHGSVGRRAETGFFLLKKTQWGCLALSENWGLELGELRVRHQSRHSNEVFLVWCQHRKK